MDKTEIAVVMASDVDLPVMKEAALLLDRFGVRYQMCLLPVHRNPDAVFKFAREAHSTGLKVIIAGAGGAAHLPGMIAAYTSLPVIGVPTKTNTSIDGLDALYSMLQMPKGVPVATMALDNAENAALFALQILACSHPSYYELVIAYKNKQRGDAEHRAKQLEQKGYEKYLDDHAHDLR